MKPHLRPHARPLAAPENVIQGDRYRITVLDPGLLRLEYAESGEFEDRPSQTVLDRAFEPARFELTETDAGSSCTRSGCSSSTTSGPFSTEGLSVAAKGGVSNYDSVWRFGLHVDNLGGTARTLDEADGRVPLEDGVLSRNGIAVVDDSRSVLLDEDGWIAARRPDTLDLYVFAFGRDYRAALRALYKLTGPQPLLPRHALGNWWSRYYAYSAGEYLELMDRFAEEDLPFSVAVLDMDWHLVDIDPSLGSGWTGYTFNRELFPDPEAFMAELHERGLAVSLNVHPADGVRAHEDAYPQVAERMGIDPATELPVNFDPTDPRVPRGLPRGGPPPARGAGRRLLVAGLAAGRRDEGPRAGPAVAAQPLPLPRLRAQREPGADVLALRRDRQPPLPRRLLRRHRGQLGFAALPARVHGDRLQRRLRLVEPRHRRALLRRQGRRARRRGWVQYGVFSPILRLHSTADRFIAKEPWRFGEVARRLIGESLRLRHRLVPYIATMGLRAHEDGAPLVSPMYYDHPSERAAYGVPNQFMFGTELLVAPITSRPIPGPALGSVTPGCPRASGSTSSRACATAAGARSRCTATSTRSRCSSAPARSCRWRPTAPARTSLTASSCTCSRGGDGSFTLAEDRDDGRWARTTFTYAGGELTIGPVEGDADTLPERTYVVVPHGFASSEPIEARDGRVRLDGEPAPDDTIERLFALLDRAHMGNPVKNRIYDAVTAAPTPADAALELIAMDLDPPLLGAVTELLLAR